jgi:nicotinamidase-related amidase
MTTTVATPANFEGKTPKIDPANAAMLLIGHQSGLFQTVGDMPMPELRSRAAALARMASLAKLPVITTASVPQGPNGPLIPEIHANAPHAKYVGRRGEINAWDNPDFVAAVKATGKKQLIIAGTITSVAWRSRQSRPCTTLSGIRRCRCLGHILEDGPGGHACAHSAGWRRADGYSGCRLGTAADVAPG